MLGKTLLLLLTVMSFITGSQKYVSFHASSQSSSIKNGEPFDILVNIKPAAGIHLNANPPISVKPVDGSAVMTLRQPGLRGEYLDLARPVKIECEVKGLPEGDRTISFILGYTFCSADEGWCRMGSDTIAVNVKVGK